MPAKFVGSDDGGLDTSGLDELLPDPHRRFADAMLEEPRHHELVDVEGSGVSGVEDERVSQHIGLFVERGFIEGCKQRFVELPSVLEVSGEPLAREIRWVWWCE